MKKLLSFLLIVSSLYTYAQQTKHSRAKIYLDDKEKTLMNLAKLGLAVDHGESKKGIYFISDFSEREINLAKNNGYTVDILIDDVSTYYANQNKELPIKKKENVEGSLNSQSSDCNSSPSGTILTPSHFQLGSMGGFFTYSEMVGILDNMATEFPNLISAKQPISTFVSTEGNPIYWLKISDNPNANESEPQILYTALHHAREPASLSQMIFYMYYLLENYATNSEIKALVDNTEMYFVPCVNPDGYLYNESTNPNGGGMWRKNMRDNTDGAYGVDLNRNYGFLWGYDDTGSSPDPNDETYRGTSGFSEPETQAIKWFGEHHQFKMAINYHTYGNYLIYPWGYIADLYTSDSAVFVEHTKLMTSFNHYTAGTGNQTVQYVTNGDSDDWGYGEQNSKSKILSMTPEAGDGNDGFWPAQNNIIPICKTTLWQNIYGAELIGKYAVADDLSPSLLSTQNGYLNYSVKRLGLDNPAVYTVSVIPMDSWITSVGAPKSYSNMALLQVKNDSISYTLNSAITSGQTFKYILRVNNGYYNRNDTITKTYGIPATAYNNNCTSLTGFTSVNGNWGISNSQYVSAPNSITDSPNGNYSNNSNKKLIVNAPIDLTSVVSASLNFWTKWDIEAGYDFVEVMASTDGGTYWTPLCGKYTHSGGQDAGNPLYDGNQSGWVWEEMSLNDYIGQTIKIQFKLESDQGAIADGFYFDDLTVNTVSVSSGINETKNVIHVSQNIPNPATAFTFINFTLNSKKNSTFTIYNSLGQLVKQEKIADNQNSVVLDIRAFAPGTYFYQVGNDSDRSKMMKMVIMK